MSTAGAVWVLEEVGAKQMLLLKLRNSQTGITWNPGGSEREDKFLLEDGEFKILLGEPGDIQGFLGTPNRSGSNWSQGRHKLSKGVGKREENNSRAKNIYRRRRSEVEHMIE